MNLKNILLGTSASALFVTGAVAADLPVAPEPVDYVRVCDVHGTGFFYIPGTETCLQVGGDVRSRYTYNDINAGSRAGSPSEFSARGRIWLDARNESEWGSIRTYIRYTASTDTNGAGGGAAELDRAFVQVGNFVTGYASSFMNLTYGAYAINNVYGTFDSDNTTWLAGYTFDLGNGAYFAASIEAPERSGFEFDDDTIGIVAPGGYGGVTWPDAGFNLGIDQGWGSAGIVAGIHQVRPADSTGVGLDSEIGWFVGAGAEFNVLSTTKIGGTAFYSDGAMARLGTDVPDAIINSSGTGISTTTAWSANLGISHDLTSEIAFSLNGGYFSAENDFGGIDLEANAWMVGASVEYTPLSGLTFGAGVEYIDADVEATAGGASISGDEDAYAITLQVVRSF
ncbi:MAG: porin [Stappiaceae bacterium]